MTQEYINSLIQKIPLTYLKLIKKHHESYKLHKLKDEYFKKYHTWNEIIENETLSMEFIEKFQFDISGCGCLCAHIVMNQSFTEEFIENHPDDLVWSELLPFQILSPFFIWRKRYEIFEERECGYKTLFYWIIKHTYKTVKHHYFGYPREKPTKKLYNQKIELKNIFL